MGSPSEEARNEGNVYIKRARTGVNTKEEKYQDIQKAFNLYREAIRLARNYTERSYATKNAGTALSELLKLKAADGKMLEVIVQNTCIYYENALKYGQVAGQKEAWITALKKTYEECVTKGLQVTESLDPGPRSQAIETYLSAIKEPILRYKCCKYYLNVFIKIATHALDGGNHVTAMTYLRKCSDMMSEAKRCCHIGSEEFNELKGLKEQLTSLSTKAKTVQGTEQDTPGETVDAGTEMGILPETKYTAKSKDSGQQSQPISSNPKAEYLWRYGLLLAECQSVPDQQLVPGSLNRQPSNCDSKSLAASASVPVDGKREKKCDSDRLFKNLSHYFYIPGYSADVVDFPSTSTNDDSPSESEEENQNYRLFKKLDQYFYIPGYSADVVDFPSSNPTDGPSSKSVREKKKENLTKDINCEAAGKSSTKFQNVESGESQHHQYREDMTEEGAAGMKELHPKASSMQ